MPLRSLVLVAVLSAASCPSCAVAPRRSASVAAQRLAQVRWEPWSARAFARARRQGRPLLIDVVAGWCHWCHVMDAETYADPEVAALLTDHFVAVRVDADARPDVAERYERWGWPATILLTADARPILERRGFVPARAFAALLGRVAADVAAGRSVARIEAPPGPRPASVNAADALAPLRARLDGFWDPAQSGWGRPQKYPWSAPLQEALWRGHVADDATMRERASSALSQTMRLVDPVWGGMYQYSVGGVWDRPHFEKIASVQAGALIAFARAGQATGDDRWLAPARRIHQYLDAFLRSPDGAYWASQDADLGGPARIDGHDYYALDDAGRRRLGVPRVDRHVYADLDGELIEALCALYDAGGDPEALADAVRAADLVQQTHENVPGSYAHEVATRGGLVHLADEVAMGRALLALDRSTAAPRFRQRAEAIARFLREHLEDPNAGGFWAHSEDPEAVGVFAERRKPFVDNASAARLLLDLAERTGDDRYRVSARRALDALVPRAAEAGIAVAELLLALEESTSRRFHLTVVGRAEAPATSALHRAALALYEPRKVVERQAPGERYPDLGRPAAYLCDDRSCSRPVTRPDELAGAAREFLRDDPE